VQGKILYVGSSNFAGWHIAQAQEAARARHFMGLVSEQSKYNLVTRDVEREACSARGLPAYAHWHGATRPPRAESRSA
jgi:aryl-alcohol dehydrogenase-like predicted oxidoreductase